jgi:hypothetical protein
VLFDGPGHRRDTVLPGQQGTSVVLGRRAAYGGPFSDIDSLRPDDLIRVTTGNGVFEFRVTGLRQEGDPAPRTLAAGEARLTLVTAAGRPFMPAGTIRVDALLTGEAAIGAARTVTSATLPDREQIMGTDSRTLWALALWLQAMLALSAAMVWAWHRWGRAQAWITLLPPLMLVGILAAGEAARLLPNLM